MDPIPTPTPTPTTPNPQNTHPAQMPQTNPLPQQAPPPNQQTVAQPPMVNPPPPTEVPSSTTDVNNTEEPTTQDDVPVKKSGMNIGVVIFIIIAVIIVIGGIIGGIALFSGGAAIIDDINPADNFADARNASRQMDVSQISKAISMYLAEWGNSVDDLGDIAQCSSGTSTIGTASGNINLASKLAPEYITMIPTDPTEGSEGNTGYTICISATGGITISAPAAENGENISETR